MHEVVRHEHVVPLAVERGIEVKPALVPDDVRVRRADEVDDGVAIRP